MLAVLIWEPTAFIVSSPRGWTVPMVTGAQVICKGFSNNVVREQSGKPARVFADAPSDLLSTEQVCTDRLTEISVVLFHLFYFGLHDHWLLIYCGAMTSHSSQSSCTRRLLEWRSKQLNWKTSVGVQGLGPNNLNVQLLTVYTKLFVFKKTCLSLKCFTENPTSLSLWQSHFAGTIHYLNVI